MLPLNPVETTAQTAKTFAFQHSLHLLRTASRVVARDSRNIADDGDVDSLLPKTRSAADPFRDSAKRGSAEYDD